MSTINQIWSRYKYFVVITIVCLLVILIPQNPEYYRIHENRKVSVFNKQFVKQETTLNNYMEEVKNVLNDIPAHDSLSLWKTISFEQSLSNSLAMFIWQNDSLAYWTHNTISMPQTWNDTTFNSTFMYLKTVWVVPKVEKIGDYVVVGMVLVKWVYPYENDLLTNHFSPVFSLPGSVKISSREVQDSHPIIGADGQAKFHLLFDELDSDNLFEDTLRIIAFLGIYALILIIPFVWLTDKSPSYRRRAIVLWIIVVAMIRCVMLMFNVPSFIYQSEWFNPQYLAIPVVAPSLGDLVLLAISLFVIHYYYFKFYNYSYLEQYHKKDRYFYPKGYASWLLVIIFYFLFLQDMIKKMVFNSSISIDTELFFGSLWVNLFIYVSIVLLLISFTVLYIKCIEYLKDDVPYKYFKWLLLVLSFVFLFCGAVFGHWDLFLSGLTVGAATIFIADLKFKKNKKFSYPEFIVITFCFAAFSVGLLYYYETLRSDQTKKIVALNLAKERDEIAEYLLSNMTVKLKQDTTLENLVFRDNFDKALIDNYLKREYLYGYWDKYYLQLTMCEKDDNISVSSSDPVPCYSYFYNTTVQRGTSIPNSDFYFIQNRNGLTTYLGWISYNQPSTRYLFFEFTSKYNTYEVGYPELLIERKNLTKLSLEQYSYARYYNGNLIDNFGNYSYHRTDEYVGDIDVGQFKVIHDNRYKHTIYNAGEGTMFVLSDAQLSFWTILVAFSYIFISYVIVVSIIYLLENKKDLKDKLAFTFQNKIQYSVLIMMIIFTVIISWVSANFMLTQSRKKNNDVVSEKLYTISTELKNEMETRWWQSFSKDAIETMLFEKSNVYATDLNFYTTNGMLVASSRPEIFEKNLLGSQISPKVYERMTINGEMLVIEQEMIGALNYISAYFPVMDEMNQVVGIINIPYFTEHNVLSREITTLLVTTINLFILLFLLGVVLSVAISRQLTLPLRILQQYLGKVQLSTQFELIHYSGHDEIGDLVSAYNDMVNQLANNVDKLAKSERESAWREMAKQIAHEIKNPLTPMKLSIQHIQRAKKLHRDDFDEMFDKVTSRIVDQIDLLSDIASQFSHFASMSVMNFEQVDIVQKLEGVMGLFDNMETEFVRLYDNTVPIWVWADEKRLSQVFTNLIKNGIQAVPETRKPIITLKIVARHTQVWIRISDNGEGIPEEMTSKIFEPNFTTKTSGMGLGLAIVKNIVETCQGDISFTTKQGKGTSFLLRFPLHEQE